MGSIHISVMIAIDDATVENGCLQVHVGNHRYKKGYIHMYLCINIHIHRHICLYKSLLIINNDCTLIR